MLIASLTLSDFRKYKHLELNDLPQHGLITVSGLNESGKSSIGEGICFALFGRTAALQDEGAGKLVRWGAEQGHVALKLSNGKRRYIVERTIFPDGKQSARVLDSDNQKILVEGVVRSNDMIFDLLGYDYNTFADSFFLAAMDFNSPDPDSNSIRDMAGIGEYARISDELSAEREVNFQAVEELSPEEVDGERSLDELELDETWLPELVDTKEVLDGEVAQKQALVGDTAELSSEYKTAGQRHQKTRRGLKIWGWLSGILLTLLIVFWLLWLAFRFFPQLIASFNDAPAAQSVIPGVSSWLAEWGFPAAMGLVLISALGLFFKWRAESKLEQSLQRAGRLSNNIQSAYSNTQRPLSELMTARMRTVLDGPSSPQSALRTPPQEDQVRIDRLVSESRNFDADPIEVENTVQRLRDTLDQQQTELHTMSEPLAAELEHEKVRSDEAGQVRSRLYEVRHLLRENKQQLAVRDIAIELLQRASDNIIDDFNTKVGNRAEIAISKFTRGRYKRLRVGQDLKVTVYADEKMDWIGFDELSSGAQRQVLLATRIAMSEQLVIHGPNPEQFLFLDEPFTYFDKERTEAALDALPTASNKLAQVWVVAQRFPEKTTPTEHIECPDRGEVL